MYAASKCLSHVADIANYHYYIESDNTNLDDMYVCIYIYLKNSDSTRDTTT